MTDIQVTTEPTVPTKSPLESRTVQLAALGLMTAVVSHFNPAAGAWLQGHQEWVLGAFATAVAWGRTGGDRKLDWRDWTFKGIGIRF